MTRCPGQDQLDRLLAEELPPAERSAVEVHIEQCAHCQQTLEQLTHDPVVDTAARVHAPSRAALRPLRKDTSPTPPPAQGDTGLTQDAGAPSQADPAVLTFLAPSAEPGSLGRLGDY